MEKFDLKSGIYFVSGIDTDIGKTYATGYLANQLQQTHKVITQKLIQTGCERYADDILQHRQLMGRSLFTQDKQGLTMPAIFKYPCSPHLASQIEQKSIDLDYLHQCTEQLAQDFDIVLVEGAGGLYVPILPDFYMIDYIQQYQYPLILVTSGRLGSINHTLLSLKSIQQQQIELTAVIYNHVHDALDPMIAQDTEQYLRRYVQQNFPQTHWWQLPKM